MRRELITIILLWILSGLVNRVYLPKLAKASDGVIFFNDFEQNSVGIYTEESLMSDWNQPIIENGIVDGRVAIVEGEEALEGKSLRISYPVGAVGPGGGGAQWRMPLFMSYEELYCSYWIKFGKGFDFVKGGKIPGFTGGTGNTGGFIPDGTDGWSARMMWRPKGQVVQYVYHPDQLDMWGQDFFWSLGGQRFFRPGTWHKVEQRIKMNTPGKRDGIIEAWFDGEQALKIVNMCFRDIPELAIDGFYFSTFFGGNDSSWASTKDEHVYFDRFIISTQRIGDL